MTTPTTNTTGSVGELVHINPHDLYLGDNVRTEVSIGIDFVESISTHGVLQPVSAIRRDDLLEVRDGQRRTLAARQAGLASVPVYVTPDPATDAPGQVIRRITHQLVANDHRVALTAGERIGAVEQMLNLGVTPTKAAKALGMKRSSVEAVAVTVKSERAREEAENGTLTLEQAAGIAEFESDERALNRLISAARGGRFEHELASLRKHREEKARIAVVAQPYAERGFTILAERIWSFHGTMTQPMHWLRTSAGEPVVEDDISDAALWAVSFEEDIVYVDTATGEQVVEEDVDWTCTIEGDPIARVSDADEDEYNIPAWRISQRYDYTPTFYCNDPAAAGFTCRFSARASFSQS